MGGEKREEKGGAGKGERKRERLGGDDDEKGIESQVPWSLEWE